MFGMRGSAGRCVSLAYTDGQTLEHRLPCFHPGKACCILQHNEKPWFALQAYTAH